MIGRGAYGRPWWPGVIAEGLEPGSGRAEPSLTEEAAIVLHHHAAHPLASRPPSRQPHGPQAHRLGHRPARGTRICSRRTRPQAWRARTAAKQRQRRRRRRASRDLYDTVQESGTRHERRRRMNKTAQTPEAAAGRGRRRCASQSADRHRRGRSASASPTSRPRITSRPAATCCCATRCAISCRSPARCFGSRGAGPRTSPAWSMNMPSPSERRASAANALVDHPGRADDGASALCHRHAARALDGAQDRPPAHLARCRALGLRHGHHAGA